IHNVDVLSIIPIQSMLVEHATSGALATLAVSKRDTSRKLLFGDNGQMVGWKNEETGEIRGKVSKIKHYHDLAFSGIHIIDPVLLKMFPSADVFSIVDLYLTHCAKYPIHAFEHDPTDFLDIGKPEQLAKAEKFLNK
ncbi:MAG: nucleotidyltransferase family protein, partial [Candidatus Marinimicrobia bacterium]|nr:nucleotidyltransferase family protein [Candidatus Neomarinimicrobiota bacterium]